MNNNFEICICAAWKAKDDKIYRGHRHMHCLDAMEDATTKPTKEQGFITSKNRFVNKYEGYQLQITAGIKSIARGGYKGERLFSEDLY